MVLSTTHHASTSQLIKDSVPELLNDSFDLDDGSVLSSEHLSEAEISSNHSYNPYNNGLGLQSTTTDYVQNNSRDGRNARSQIMSVDSHG